MAAAKLWDAASSPDTVSEDDAGTITINHNLQLRSSTPQQLNVYCRQHEKLCGPATPMADDDELMLNVLRCHLTY